MARNPVWTVEEIVLATELLLNNGFRVVGPKHCDVLELSVLLNELPIHATEHRNDEFRSPSSIDRKLANIRSVNPDWTGGSTNAGKLDDYFWRVLGGNDAALRAEATAIRAKYRPNRIDSPASFEQIDSDFLSASRRGRIDLNSLPITQIHQDRLLWFLENEGSIVPFGLLDSFSEPHLISRPTGIYSPSGWDYALSIRETLDSPYGDVPIRTLANGDWVYRYHRETGDGRRSNEGLLACLRDEVPVGVLIQVAPKPNVQYFVAGLGLIHRFEDPWFELVKWDYLSDGGESASTGAVDNDDDIPRVIKKAGIEKYTRRIIRPNQPMFRVMLLSSYNKRCAITNNKVVTTLEAAHIRPYSYDRIDSVQNGLLLRADIHRLFDSGLLGVDPSNMETVTSPKLIGSEYEEYEGKVLSLPGDESLHPSNEFLDDHRKAWNLT